MFSVEDKLRRLSFPESGSCVRKVLPPARTRGSVRVTSTPLQVIGVHGELLQLSDSSQISSLQLLQSRASKPQPPQPEQLLEQGPGAQAAGGEEVRHMPGFCRVWVLELDLFTCTGC